MELTKFLANLGITMTEFDNARTNIESRISQAVARIKDAPFIVTPQTAYVGHSGGKDSVLVRYLVDQAIDSIPTVHTTKPDGVENAVHPLTQKFLYALGRPILYVPLAITEEQLGTPQFPWSIQIDGTRIAEYHRDDGRSVDVIIDGKSVSRKELPLYLTNGLFGIDFIYPIFDWSDAEVWAAIIRCNIAFSPEYYIEGINGQKDPNKGT